MLQIKTEKTQSKLKKIKLNQTKPNHVLCQSAHAHSETEICKTPQNTVSSINIIYSSEEAVLPDPVPSGITAVLSATFTIAFHSFLCLLCMMYFSISVLHYLLALSASAMSDYSVKSRTFLLITQHCKFSVS